MTGFELPLLPLILLAVALLAAAWALLVGWHAARQTADAPLPLPPSSLDRRWFSLRNGWDSVDSPEDALDGTSPQEAAEAFAEMTRAMESGQEGAPETLISAGADGERPPFLSVIVYAFDRRDSLNELVDSFSMQKTDFEYELIVVCNASAEETAAMAERLGPRRGVHVTFIPPGSHNLSRRKLAFTVGLKRASGEVALLTASNVAPPSSVWFQLMAQPFRNPDTTPAMEAGAEAGENGTVLSLGAVDFDARNMPGHSRYRLFLTATRSMRAFGAALSGRPFRGEWLNLALRRECFFKLKGYASSIHLQTGDDDLFVSEISSLGGTAAVLSPQAMPTAEWGRLSMRYFTEQREGYLLTRRWLRRGPFLTEGSLSVCQWLTLGCCLGAALVPLAGADPLWFRGFGGGFPWLPAALAGLLWVLFEALQMLAYSRGCRRLMLPASTAALPLFLLWRPFGNLIFRLNHRSAQFRNFTWQRSN